METLCGGLYYIVMVYVICCHSYLTYGHISVKFRQQTYLVLGLEKKDQGFDSNK